MKADFAAFVAKNNQCAVASECALASTSCPLGCGTPVRADRKAAVEAKARELVSEYERGGAHCDYDCVAPGAACLLEGRCATTPAP